MICANATTPIRHTRSPVVEPAPGGGWIARCPDCSSSWRPTTLEAREHEATLAKEPSQ